MNFFFVLPLVSQQPFFFRFNLSNPLKEDIHILTEMLYLKKKFFLASTVILYSEQIKNFSVETSEFILFRKISEENDESIDDTVENTFLSKGLTS